MKSTSWLMVAFILFTCGFVFNQYIIQHADAKRSVYDISRSLSDNQFIDNELVALLDHQSKPVLARLALIHNGINLPNSKQTSLFRWDVTNGKSKAPYPEPELIINRPLSEWRDYIGNMLDNACSHIVVDTMDNYDARVRLQKIGITSFLVCPVVSHANELLGGLFVSWNGQTLTDSDITEATAKTKEIAKIIVQKIEIVN